MKKKLSNALLYVQVVFAWYITLLGYGFAVCVLFTHFDRFFDKIIYAFCLGLIGFVGQKLALRTSLEELKEAQNAKKEDAYE